MTDHIRSDHRTPIKQSAQPEECSNASRQDPPVLALPQEALPEGMSAFEKDVFRRDGSHEGTKSQPNDREDEERRGRTMSKPNVMSYRRFLMTKNSPGIGDQAFRSNLARPSADAIGKDADIHSVNTQKLHVQQQQSTNPPAASLTSEALANPPAPSNISTHTAQPPTSVAGFSSSTSPASLFLRSLPRKAAQSPPLTSFYDAIPDAGSVDVNSRFAYRYSHQKPYEEDSQPAHPTMMSTAYAIALKQAQMQRFCPRGYALLDPSKPLSDTANSTIFVAKSPFANLVAVKRVLFKSSSASAVRHLESTIWSQIPKDSHLLQILDHQTIPSPPSSKPTSPMTSPHPYDHNAHGMAGEWIVLPLCSINLLEFLTVNHPQGLSPLPALGIFLQIAKGLNALHEANIVHRDVKLENVIYQPSTNRWVVTDFGLACRTQSEEDCPCKVTDTAALNAAFLPGTLPYIAPELLNTPPAARTALDLRMVDVWAAGCLFHALLTAQMPFSDPFEPRLQLLIMRGVWTVPYMLTDKGILRKVDLITAKKQKTSENHCLARDCPNDSEGVRYSHTAKAARAMLLGCLDKDLSRRQSLQQILTRCDIQPHLSWLEHHHRACDQSREKGNGSNAADQPDVHLNDDEEDQNHDRLLRRNRLHLSRNYASIPTVSEPFPPSQFALEAVESNELGLKTQSTSMRHCDICPPHSHPSLPKETAFCCAPPDKSSASPTVHFPRPIEDAPEEVGQGELGGDEADRQAPPRRRMVGRSSSRSRSRPPERLTQSQSGSRRTSRDRRHPPDGGERDVGDQGYSSASPPLTPAIRPSVRTRPASIPTFSLAHPKNLETPLRSSPPIFLSVLNQSPTIEEECAFPSLMISN